MHIKNFDDATKALVPYWPSKIKTHLNTLEHIRAFMNFLGNPQDQLKTIHVAGTSGKTSTAYYAAALLKAAGKKVGLTVSPHVDQLNERVQINLTPLPEKLFCQELEEFLKLVEASGITLSYFEIMYTFAYQQFLRAKVDYAVVEVGMGGLLDSTNVINREDKICVITDIGLDHTHILGTTIREIAAHKAGIIHLGNTVFCYKQDPVIMEVITATAQQRQADLHIVPLSETKDKAPFLPLFQQRNLGLAYRAASWALARDAHAPLTRPQVLEAAHILIPARMEVFERDGKTIIIDAAHNYQKLEALGQSMHAKYQGQPVAALVSMAAGRDDRLEEATRELATIADHLIVTTFGGPEDGPHHSVDPHELAAACKRHGARSIEIIEDSADALQALLKRPEPLALVTGSFYLLNHIRPLLRG